MKKLNINEMETVNGGICQLFPGRGCFPAPCWAGLAIGLIEPGNPNMNFLCPA